MVRNEVAVARWVAKIDGLVREHGFYSEEVSDFIYETVETDLPIRLAQYALKMATVPDGLWTKDIRTFVNAMDELVSAEFDN